MGSVLSSYLGDSEQQQTPNDDASSPVTQFHSSARWQLHLNEFKDSSQLVVVYFSASWCAPCRLLKLAIHALASNYTDVHFNKIDVDELPDVAKEFEVQAMPTIVLLKQGKEIDRVVGANKDELERKIQQHRSNS